jgi:hypothetical protein
MKTILEPKREIPVLAEVDVVVVGGGPAGIGAALSSARNGAKTILIEQFGCLGGLQTQGFNTSFSYVDPEIQGGILRDILDGLKKNGGLLKDRSKDTRLRRGMGGVFFDIECYKYILDGLMEEAGVKLLYHSFGVGAIKEGNTMKGVFIECLEGKRAILGKVVIDSTGNADIAWKSGAPCMSEGFPSGPPKGRHMGFGYALYIGNVDINKLKKLRKEQPEEWGSMHAAMGLIKKAKAEGKLYGNRAHFLISEVYGPGKIWMLGPQYPLPMGHDGWKVEELTAGEIDLRKQARSAYNLLKENVPGFENAHIEKTPNIPMLRDTHRILGEYILKEEDIRQGKAFADSIAVSNMSPDVFGPDDEHELILNVPPYDIPYRCLVSKETDNLLAAGSTISVDFITYCATRYCAPSICTGQAAGTAAALAVKNQVTPRKLDVKLLQETLRRQGARISVKYVPREVLEEYKKNTKKSTYGLHEDRE